MRMRRYIGILLLIILCFAGCKINEIGLDTANTTLIVPEAIVLKHISQTDFKPFQIDNDDDYVSCDRYRIIDTKGKVGFANGDGYVVMEPKFAFAFPYEKGIAKVTEKGVLKEVKRSDGEYHYWESDDWYYINMSGDWLSSAMNSSDGVQKADNIDFVYFNNEWIIGAGINMVCPDSITNIEIKNDEYGNKCAFVSLTSSAFESLKSQAEKFYEDAWIELGPFCEFPGGMANMMKWQKENIRIPEGYKGRERVIVYFMVQPDGKVCNSKIIKGSENEELNSEALRLVESLPRFDVMYCTPQKEPQHFTWPILFEEKDSLHNKE